jgi:hypothetical protein
MGAGGRVVRWTGTHPLAGCNELGALQAAGDGAEEERMIGWNRRRWAWKPLLLIGATLAGGCAGASQIEVPATLPNTTQQDFLTLRWALAREGGVARAVGVAETSGAVSWDAAVDLYGLDAGGRIVSRGWTVVRPSFSQRTAPFEVRAVETGRETEFRLVVVRSRQFSRPGD